MVEIIFLANNISTGTIVIAIAGYLIVFFSLLLLYLFFQYLPRLINLKLLKSPLTKRKSGIETGNHILGEETAAISVALHLFFNEIHDEESSILTIKKTSKAYSPWSSKIYAVRNQFNRI